MPFRDQGQPPKRICLGKIAGVHGVKGLVKILPFGEDPALLENGPLYTSEDGQTSLTLHLKNAIGKFILASVKGVETREQAEALGKCSLYVPRETLPEIEDDDGFYYEDLIGLKALDKDGNHIGKVIAVDDFGAGDLLDIQPLSGKSFYVPFRPEYVLSTDLEAGTITIIPLEME